MSNYRTRYGNPRRGIPTGKIVAVGFALMMAVFIGLLGLRFMNQENPIKISAVTHERLDDDLLRVWVDITRSDVSSPSYCIVTALDYSMAEVGRREVIMPAGGEASTRVAVDIPTRNVPVAGDVYGCRSGLEPYMDVANAVTTL